MDGDHYDDDTWDDGRPPDESFDDTSAAGGRSPPLTVGVGVACVFGGEDGIATSSAAAIVAGTSSALAACVVPRGVPAGFVSVGVSGNGGVDARFFHYDEVTVNFASVGEMTRALGSGVGTWARYDPVHVFGRGMIPREANHASVGQSAPCGWWTSRAGSGGDASSGGVNALGGGSAGIFVSSALRTCEAPPASDGAWVVATTEPALGAGAAWHGGHYEPRGAAERASSAGGPAVVVAEPPRVTSVRPGATAAEGGGVLLVVAVGRSDGGWDGGDGRGRHRHVAAVGTVRVAVDAGNAASGADTWRCVAPARAPTQGSTQGGTHLGGAPRQGVSIRGGGASVALMTSHFGASVADRGSHTRVRFVPPPRAGLVGGPAVGVADAAVPSPAEALFRLFFSPLPPRALTLWCVVGGGAGLGSKVPSSGTMADTAACTPPDGQSAGFVAVTLLWAGGDSAGAASGQVMYAPRPRVLTATPASTAGVGGAGPAPVAVIGGDILPPPGNAGESGGVACAVKGRALAAETSWISSALVLCDLSSSLHLSPAILASSSSTNTTAASAFVPLFVAAAPVLTSASSVGLAPERGGAAGASSLGIARPVAPEHGGASLVVEIVGASTNPNDASEGSESGGGSGDVPGSGSGRGGLGGGGVGNPLPNCRVGTVSPLVSRPVHGGAAVECTAPGKPPGSLSAVQLAWSSRAEYWGPGDGGSGGLTVEYVTPPRAMALVPRGAVASGEGGAGHHAQVLVAAEPPLSWWRGGGRGKAAGGDERLSFGCVLARGGDVAPRTGIWRAGRNGGLDACVIHVGTAALGFTVLSMVPRDRGGGEAAAHGAFTFTTGATFHVAPPVRLHAVYPSTAPAGRLVPAAVVHVVAQDLPRPDDHGTAAVGETAACEFHLPGVSASAPSDGGGRGTATRASTPIRVVSSALASCEAPEGETPGMAPLRVGASDTVAAFAYVATPAPASAAPQSGPSAGGSVVVVFGGGVGSAFATLGAPGVGNGSAAGMGVGAAEGTGAGGVCGFGTVGPVDGRTLATEGRSGVSGSSRDLECVSPAGTGGSAVQLRVRSSPGGWARPHGAGLAFYYEMDGRGTDPDRTGGGPDDATALSSAPSGSPLADGLVDSGERSGVSWLAATSASAVYHTWCITSGGDESVTPYATLAVVVSSRLVACEMPLGAAGFPSNGFIASTRLSHHPWDFRDSSRAAYGDAVGSGVLRHALLTSPPEALTARVSTPRGLIAAPQVEGDVDARARGPAAGGTRVIVTVSGGGKIDASTGGIECAFGTVGPVSGIVVQGEVRCSAPAGVEGTTVPLRVRTVGGPWSESGGPPGEGAAFTYEPSWPAAALWSSWTPPTAPPTLRRAASHGVAGGSLVWLTGSGFGFGARDSIREGRIVGDSLPPLLCLASPVASAEDVYALSTTQTVALAAHVVSSAVALCEGLTHGLLPDVAGATRLLHLGLARGDGTDASDDEAASKSEESGRITVTLRAAPRVVGMSPEGGAVEGGTLVTLRWAARSEPDAASAACRFGTLGPIRGWVVEDGAGTECVSPAVGAIPRAVTVAVRIGGSGWSTEDGGDTAAVTGFGASTGSSGSLAFAYASRWRPERAVPALVPASPPGGDDARAGRALIVSVLGAGYPPRGDPAAACAGLPRATALRAVFGIALCSVAAEQSVTPPGVSFVVVPAPVVLRVTPDAAPTAAAAAVATPHPAWILGRDLSSTALHCCLGVGNNQGGAVGGRWLASCAPAVAVSSAFASCELPTGETDRPPGASADDRAAWVSLDAAGGAASAFSAAARIRTHAVPLALLGLDAVPVALSATPAVGPVEGGTLVSVETATGAGGSPGGVANLPGTDYGPECQFGVVGPIAGRWAGRGGVVLCVSPAGYGPVVPVAARGRPAASGWPFGGGASFEPRRGKEKEEEASGGGFAGGGGTSPGLFVPPAVPPSHFSLVALPGPRLTPGWHVIDISGSGDGTGGVVVMVEAAPKLSGASTRVTLAGGGVLTWVRGEDLLGCCGEGMRAVMRRSHRRSHRSHGGAPTVAFTLVGVSSAVAVFEAPSAPPGVGPGDISAMHPASGLLSRSSSTAGGDGGAGIAMAIVPEPAPDHLPGLGTPPTALGTTEGGNAVTVPTTLGAAAADAAACAVGSIGPWRGRGLADGRREDADGGEVECVTPARAPGRTTATARPTAHAGASWPDRVTAAVVPLVVRAPPRVSSVALAYGGLVSAIAAALSGEGGGRGAARFTLFGRDLPQGRAGAAGGAAAGSSLDLDLDLGLGVGGSHARSGAGRDGFGFVAVAVGHPPASGRGEGLPAQVEVRAPGAVLVAHVTSAPSGGGAVVHLGGRSFGVSSRAGGEIGASVCAFVIGAGVEVLVGAAVAVSSAVAACETPGWPTAGATGGSAEVLLGRSAPEDAAAALLFGGEEQKGGDASAAALAPARSSSRAFTFTFASELASVEPTVSPGSGASSGGELVVVSGVGSGAHSAREWRCWFGVVGPVSGTASRGVTGGGGECVTPAHAVGHVFVRSCPTPSCGNAGDLGATVGAGFVYARPGELARGDDASVPSAWTMEAPNNDEASVLLVGWGLDGVADTSVRSSSRAVAVAPSSHLPPPSMPACVVGNRARPARSVSAGWVTCGAMGSRPAGFHAVPLLVHPEGGGTALVGAQVEFADPPVVSSASPSLGPSGGGGIAWVGGVSLHRASGVGAGLGVNPCAFGGTRGAHAVGAFISSGLVACEAPPAPPSDVASASGNEREGVSTAGDVAGVAPRAVALRAAGEAVERRSGERGANVVAYTYLPSTDLFSLEPSAGPVHGGTRLRLRVTHSWGGGSGGGACRFGTVVVAAAEGSRGGDGGGGVLCVAPARMPGWTDVAVGGAAGAACDSTGAGFAAGTARARYRYHLLD